MGSNITRLPSQTVLAVGRQPALGTSETNLDFIFERFGALGDVLGEIQNDSKTENLVVALQNGSTNLEANYATRQIRVGTALVNSVTVPPLARVSFVVDGPNAEIATQRFWRFRASNQQRAWGTVTVSHGGGELRPVSLFPT